MISLKPQTEPYEIELPYGVTVTVKPLTTAGMAAAQAAARRRIESLESQARERRESGLPLEGLPDLEDEAERDGLYQDLLIKELGTRHITTWTPRKTLTFGGVTPELASGGLPCRPFGPVFRFLMSVSGVSERVFLYPGALRALSQTRRFIL